MQCNKDGSNLICFDKNICVCTLPVKKTKWIILLVVILSVCIFACCVTKKDNCKIKTNVFQGRREGYVFKTEDGITGYYKDKQN